MLSVLRRPGFVLCLALIGLSCSSSGDTTPVQTGAIPENSFLTSDRPDSGWECTRGFVKKAGLCAQITMPPNAYLKDYYYGSGVPWKCERGFAESGASCKAIAVPEYGYLAYSRDRDGWMCERGFVKSSNGCVEVVVPENGHLVDNSANQGWACMRGYEKKQDACELVAIPENAYFVDNYGRPVGSVLVATERKVNPV